MAYVASKAENARSGTPTPGSPRNAAEIPPVPDLGTDQIREQLGRSSIGSWRRLTV